MLDGVEAGVGVKAALMQLLEPGLQVIADELARSQRARGEPTVKPTERRAIAVAGGGLMGGSQRLDEATSKLWEYSRGGWRQRPQQLSLA